jgi:hypothetical protein
MEERTKQARATSTQARAKRCFPFGHFTIAAEAAISTPQFL